MGIGPEVLKLSLPRFLWRTCYPVESTRREKSPQCQEVKRYSTQCIIQIKNKKITDLLFNSGIMRCDRPLSLRLYTKKEYNDKDNKKLTYFNVGNLDTYVKFVEKS